jgi:hypothetical protein
MATLSVIDRVRQILDPVLNRNASEIIHAAQAVRSTIEQGRIEPKKKRTEIANGVQAELEKLASKISDLRLFVRQCYSVDLGRIALSQDSETQSDLTPKLRGQLVAAVKEANAASLAVSGFQTQGPLSRIRAKLGKGGGHSARVRSRI